MQAPLGPVSIVKVTYFDPSSARSSLGSSAFMTSRLGGQLRLSFRGGFLRKPFGPIRLDVYCSDPVRFPTVVAVVATGEREPTDMDL